MSNDFIMRIGDLYPIPGVDPRAGAACDVHEVRESMLFENARSRTGTIATGTNHCGRLSWIDRQVAGCFG